MQRRPRGSGSVYREGPAWSIRHGPRSAKRYETGFRTKAEAERRLALVRAEEMHRRLGVATDPRLAPTLAELAEPWLERRKATHAAGGEDGSRWARHLAPFLGHRRPDEVGQAEIRAFIEAKRGEMASGTLRVVISVLSALYDDLLERDLARANPAKGLPRSLARLMRSSHDPRTTPFLERLEDVRRVYLTLPEPFNVAFALGALAGLRTGEVFALRWRSVDLAAGQMLISESVRGPTKDRDPRPVPILDPLRPVLEAWRLRTGGAGLVIPPRRRDAAHVDKHVPGRVLQPVLRDLQLARPGLGWYEATRHTFASQWAMAGRPLRELQKILGHSSIAITERYAHLAPDYWAPGVHGALQVSLQKGGSVAQISAETRPVRRVRTRKR